MREPSWRSEGEVKNKLDIFSISRKNTLNHRCVFVGRSLLIAFFMESVGEIKKLIKTIFIQSQNFVSSKNGFSVVENASFPRNRHQAHSIFSWSFYTRAPHNPFPSRRHPPRSTVVGPSVWYSPTTHTHLSVRPALEWLCFFFNYHLYRITS